MSDVHPIETVKASGGKKLGPLPVWGWGLILGAVAVAFMYYHNSRNASANASAADPTQIPQDQVTGTGLDSSGSNPGDTAAMSDQIASMQLTDTAQNQQDAKQNREIKRLQNQEKRDNQHAHHHGTRKDVHPHGGSHATPHHRHHKRGPHISADPTVSGA